MIGDLDFDAYAPDNCVIRDLDLPISYSPSLDVGGLKTEYNQDISGVLADSSHVVLQLGGKFGRIGESIITSAFIYPVHEALLMLGRHDTKITLIVDRGVSCLYDRQLYSFNLGRQLDVIPADPSLSNSVAQKLCSSGEENIFLFDFNGGNEKHPQYMCLEFSNAKCRHRISVLSNLFRSSVRCFAALGALERYARFIEHILVLPSGSVDRNRSQPNILLGDQDELRYEQLMSQLAFDPSSINITCFFQSVVSAKCYGHWEDVLMGISNFLKRIRRDKMVNFIMACNSDDSQSQRFSAKDLREQFTGFSGANNARCVVCQISLRDVAIVSKHSVMTLSNDTGPAHIAGAVGTPVVVPFLPGNVYSMAVWSSSLPFRGLTLEPNPYRFDEIRDAVAYGYTHIIDSIQPEVLIQRAVDTLLDNGIV